MKKQILFLLLILPLITLSACSSNNDIKNKKSSEVKIYYLDASSSKMVSENYTPKETAKADQVKELLKVLKQAPKNVLYKSALPDEVIVKNFSFDKDERLTINFEPSYDDLESVTEVLCRAAIVKTLSQIKDVEYIYFNVNDQPLKDSGGDVVGTNTADKFIESTGAETNYKVSLYFTNQDGNTLKAALTDIYYTGTSSIEELVINKLINGPTEIGMYHTIPDGTILLNVTTNTKEGICTVDFNEKFMDGVPNSKDEDCFLLKLKATLMVLFLPAEKHLLF
jgi:germination protein M